MRTVPVKIIVQSVEMNIADFVFAGRNLPIYLDSVLPSCFPRASTAEEG